MTTEGTDEAPPPFYKLPDEKVRPGDVYRLAPFLNAAKAPIVHIGSNKSVKNGREQTELLGGAGAPVPKLIAEGLKETQFALRGKFAFAVLLTRGCDVDNGKQRQLAAIRPLTTVQGVDEQASVIEGRHTSLHYIPEATRDGVLIFPESFIDFRYIVTLDSSAFEQLERAVSLDPAGLLDVYFGWMRHAIGRQIPATLACASCGAPIPVFAEIAEIASPATDY